MPADGMDGGMTVFLTRIQTRGRRHCKFPRPRERGKVASGRVRVAGKNQLREGAYANALSVFANTTRLARIFHGVLAKDAKGHEMTADRTLGPAFDKPQPADCQSAIQQTASLRYIGLPWFC